MEEFADLIQRAHRGDKKAREKIIEDNLGLVHALTGRMSYCRNDREDLFQIGTIGLIKAIDRFDESFQVCFSTYAVPLILGEIKRYLRDDGMVKISRSIKENSYRLKKWRNEYEAKTGKEPSMEEICHGVGLSREDAVMAMEADRQMESIFEQVNTQEGKSTILLEHIGAEGRGTSMGTLHGGAEDFEKNELLNKMLIRQLMEELEEGERKILFLRFFENKTQMQVADLLGSSQVRISRIEKKLLTKLKNKVLTGNGNIL